MGIGLWMPWQTKAFPAYEAGLCANSRAHRQFVRTGMVAGRRRSARSCGWADRLVRTGPRRVAFRCLRNAPRGWCWSGRTPATTPGLLAPRSALPAICRDRKDRFRVGRNLGLRPSDGGKPPLPGRYHRMTFRVAHFLSHGLHSLGDGLRVA